MLCYLRRDSRGDAMAELAMHKSANEKFCAKCGELIRKAAESSERHCSQRTEQDRRGVHLSIIAFIEAIILLTMTDEAFAAKYGGA